MSISTDSITVSMARLALDAASMRHQAIANNIANANTAGYAPVRVDFESQMNAVRATLQQGGTVTPSMLQGVTPVLRRDVPPAEAGQGAALDMEIASLAQNTVQYQALLKALSKHMSILSAAVAEGKR